MREILGDLGVGSIRDRGCTSFLRSRSRPLRSREYKNLGVQGTGSYTGSATVRASNSEFDGSPTSSAAVSIGPNSRLVATDCVVMNSWIGFEMFGKQTDSIIRCRMVNNELYALRFDSSDATDYTSGNYIENDTASAANMGYFINRQDIYSVNDTLRGGYNWGFNFYSTVKPNLRAYVSDLRMKGKPGDTWGVVLNGPASIWDSAFVIESTVDSVFDGAHLYMRYLYAYIGNCTFQSLLNAQSSSPYAIRDMGETIGRVKCTRARNVSQACVYRASGSAISYGDASSAFKYGNNTIHVTDTVALPSTYYFQNFGSDSAKAEKNWWGKATPNPSRFSGPVDYNPTLTTLPLCNSGYEEKSASIPEPEIKPLGFALEQNVPNPFNPTTTIRFQLPLEQMARIDVFNILGRLVRSFDLGILPAGKHEVSWDGRDGRGQPLGSGVYLYRISLPDFTETKKMLLLK